MARIRTIKPEFWTSEQVMECRPVTRLMFIGIWNFCDDAGNHPASAKTIKALVFPGDDISVADVHGMLAELSANGLLAIYEASGKDYLHVIGWSHQKIEKPTVKYPKYLPQIDECSASSRRLIAEKSDTGSGCLDPGREGEGIGKDQHNSLGEQVDLNAAEAMTLDWKPDDRLLKAYATRQGLPVTMFTHEATAAFVCHYSASGRAETHTSWVSLLVKWVKSDKTISATGNVSKFPGKASAAGPDFSDDGWRDPQEAEL